MLDGGIYSWMVFSISGVQATIVSYWFLYSHVYLFLSALSFIKVQAKLMFLFVAGSDW